MSNRQCEIRFVVESPDDGFTRPTVVPGNEAPRYRIIGGEPIPISWEIYNAPRPLLGDLAWLDTKAGVRGYFFAAVDPTGERADLYREKLAENNAARLVYITKEQFYRTVEAYAAHQYPDRDLNPRDYKVRELSSTFSLAIEAGFDPRDYGGEQ